MPPTGSHLGNVLRRRHDIRAFDASCGTGPTSVLSRRDAERPLKVRAWRPSDASDTARIWRECLFDAGLTNYQPGWHWWQPPESLQNEVAESLIRLHTRKLQAGNRTRSLRNEAFSRLALPLQDLDKQQQSSEETRELVEHFRWMDQSYFYNIVHASVLHD